MSTAEVVKEKVEALLRDKGLRAADMVERMDISTSTYYDMWKNGYVTIDRLVAMAEFLGVAAERLLPDEHQAVSEPSMMVREPEGPTYRRTPLEPIYLEQRVARLEVEVRQLREKLRTR